MDLDSHLTTREEQIIALLKRYPQASNKLLMDQLFLSRSTLRRSLIELEAKGLILRYHGGIILKERNRHEDSADQRIRTNRQEKIAIAAAASTLLRDEMVLFLDSSSTVSYLAPHLARYRLTIITNNVDLAKDLRNVPELDVYLVPGRLRPRSTSTIGVFALNFVRQFRADLCFFSCKAVREDGFYEGDIEQGKVKEVMLEGAKDVWLLCDNSKFDSDGLYHTADFSRLAGLITSDPLPTHIAKVFETLDCEQIVAR